MFRVETPEGQRSQYIVDNKTKRVKVLRNDGSKRDRVQADDDPVSRAIVRAEAQGLEEGEMKLILMPDGRQTVGQSWKLTA